MTPVTVPVTTEAAVAPVAVTTKPVIYVVFPVALANVAVAVAFATLPESAVIAVAPNGKKDASTATRGA
jgi:hypothetical protein